MLSPGVVIDYIKRNLGVPMVNLEISDEDILFYINEYTIRLFSKHRPYVQYIVLDRGLHPELYDDDRKVITLPDTDHEIMTILSVIQMNKYIITGHPYNPIPSWGGLPQYLEESMQAMTAYRYSQFNITYEFIRPNELRIYPYSMVWGDSFLVVRAAFLNSIETVPEDWSRDFLDLALADIMDYVANLRSKYQNFTTPYGEINLNADNLRSQASDIRTRVMENLQGTIPDSFVLIG